MVVDRPDPAQELIVNPGEFMRIAAQGGGKLSGSPLIEQAFPSCEADEGADGPQNDDSPDELQIETQFQTATLEEGGWQLADGGHWKHGTGVLTIHVGSKRQPMKYC